MAKGTRKCKICGKEYEYCKTNRPAEMFRWQNVACCPEHGAEYFRQIAISRGQPVPPEVTAMIKKDTKAESVPAKKEKVVTISEEVFADTQNEDTCASCVVSPPAEPEITEMPESAIVEEPKPTPKKTTRKKTTKTE